VTERGQGRKCEKQETSFLEKKKGECACGKNAPVYQLGKALRVREGGQDGCGTKKNDYPAREAKVASWEKESATWTPRGGKKKKTSVKAQGRTGGGKETAAEHEIEHVSLPKKKKLLRRHRGRTKRERGRRNSGGISVAGKKRLSPERRGDFREKSGRGPSKKSKRL